MSFVLSNVKSVLDFSLKLLFVWVLISQFGEHSVARFSDLFVFEISKPQICLAIKGGGKVCKMFEEPIYIVSSVEMDV